MARLAGRDVAIIGAGIGGLTAAICFARAGAVVTVHEQAAHLTEVGAGLQISPNGARVLHALGLGDGLAAIGVAAQAIQPMNAQTGRPVARLDLGTRSPPYRFLYRYDLVRLLFDAATAAGVTFAFGHRVDTVTVDGCLRIDGADHTPDLLIGADGLHSVVRPLLIPDATPFFTGQVAWRAVVRDVAAEPVARVWMAPGKHVVTYPLRRGALNIVAVQERRTWAAEGWAHTDDPANLQAAFADCGPDLRAILSRIDTCNLWGLFRHPVASTWGRGRIAILGDAAHPTLPFLAQGANLAIEDAHVLVAALSANDSDASGIAAYQHHRKARVTRAIDAANANARNYHLSGLTARAAHLGLGAIARFAPAAFLSRLAWLYDHDVTAVDYQLAAV